MRNQRVPCHSEVLTFSVRLYLKLNQNGEVLYGICAKRNKKHVLLDYLVSIMLIDLWIILCVNFCQKFLVVLACIALASADVSELKKDYLPPTSTQAPTTTTTAKPLATSLGQSSFGSIPSPLHPSISTYSSFGVNMQYYSFITVAFS